MVIFIVGLLLMFTGLFSLYGDVSKCGFGAGGTCHDSNTHGMVAKAGSIIAPVGLCAVFIFMALFITAQSKENRLRK